MYRLLSIFVLGFALYSCAETNSNHEVSKTQMTPADIESAQVAYFASGCFWCVEAVYESVKGVDEVINGYAGGHTLNPTYQASNTGRTGHAEAVTPLSHSSLGQPIR